MISSLLVMGPHLWAALLKEDAPILQVSTSMSLPNTPIPETVTESSWEYGMDTMVRVEYRHHLEEERTGERWKEHEARIGLQFRIK